MLLAIDAIYPPEAEHFAQALAEPLAACVGIQSHQVHVHTPNPATEHDAFPVTPGYSSAATFLELCAKLRACMDRIDREDAGHLHLVAGWQDTFMGAAREASIKRWESVFALASRLVAQTSIHLTYLPHPETPLSVTYGPERMERQLEVLRARRSFKEHPPTLVFSKPVWAEDSTGAELQSTSIQQVADFILQRRGR